MRNKYNITKSEQEVTILHNINSDVLIEENYSLGVKTVREAEIVKKRAERLFKHFSQELQTNSVLHTLSIEKTERKISFSAKEAKKVIKILQSNSQVSSESEINLDDIDALAQLLLSSRIDTMLDEKESKLLAKSKNTADSAHSDDWRDLRSDIVPFLESLVPTENRSTALSKPKGPSFFSRLCCCIPSRPKEEMKEHLIKNSY